MSSVSTTKEETHTPAIAADDVKMGMSQKITMVMCKIAFLVIYRLLSFFHSEVEVLMVMLLLYFPTLFSFFQFLYLYFHVSSPLLLSLLCMDQAVIYGVVQAILAIPVMYGYAAIVFSDQIYHPFMPSLAKLMLFSSIVHSISFCVLSTIPFAIGLVQDAGLIFLSKIATDIAMRLEGEDPETIVATSLVVIAIGTTTLGLVLVLIGRAKLAKFVSFLPMPVIGGYLGFIGFFCVEAGLSLASGKVVNGIETWHNLMNDRSVVLW